jgi:hypothetical protein
MPRFNDPWMERSKARSGPDPVCGKDGAAKLRLFTKPYVYDRLRELIANFRVPSLTASSSVSHSATVPPLAELRKARCVVLFAFTVAEAPMFVVTQGPRTPRLHINPVRTRRFA